MLLLKNVVIKKTEKNRKGCFSSYFKTGEPVNHVPPTPAPLHNISSFYVWHRCFTVNVEKFLRTPFLQNPSGRLLLKVIQWNLYKGDTIGVKESVRFIEIFSNIVWPQSKAICSLSYCPSYEGVRFIGRLSSALAWL